MSLATNLAVADALLAAGTGLFRVMPEPDERAQQRLRHTARALGIAWPEGTSLADFSRSLDGTSPKPAALLMAIRRAGGGASYVPFVAGQRPVALGDGCNVRARHSTFAPPGRSLRRDGRHWLLPTVNPSPQPCEAAFPKLPEVMEIADDRAGQIERAVVDLAETALLSGQVQRTFPAVVTDVDERGARIQLCDLPVMSRLDAHHVEPGDDVRVRVVSTDIPHREAKLERVA